MKKLSIILVTLVILAFISCNFTFYKFEAATGNYVALGDSIPAGYGLSNKNERYTNLLANKVGMTQKNLAVSGHKTSDLLDVIKNQTNLGYIKNADLITISIGGNDMINSLESILSALFGSDEIFSNCETNLNQITYYLKLHTKKDCIIIYQNIANCYKYTSSGPIVNKAIQRLNELIAKQCDDKKVFLCDVASSLEQSGDNFFATQGGDLALDPHPTSQGHTIIANEMYKTFVYANNKIEKETTSVIPVVDTTSSQTTKTTIVETTIPQTIETTTVEITSAQTTIETTSINTTSYIETTSETTYVDTTIYISTETTPKQTENEATYITSDIVETETSSIVYTQAETTEESTTKEIDTTSQTTIIEIESTTTSLESSYVEIITTNEDSSISTSIEISTIETTEEPKTTKQTDVTTTKKVEPEAKKSKVGVYVVIGLLVGVGVFVVVMVIRKQKHK